MNLIGDVKGKVAVMVDDMIDTAATLIPTLTSPPRFRKLENYRVFELLIASMGRAISSGPNLSRPISRAEDIFLIFWLLDEKNFMIMSWLWYSIDNTISDTCMFLKTAKDIWDYISCTYLKANDAAQVYETNVKTAVTKQGNKSNLWQELDRYYLFDMKCTEDATLLKFIAKDRVYDFMAGLNPEFDQVGIQILSKDTSSLEETISMVRTEESRSVLLEPQNIEGSALVTKQELPQKYRNDLPNKPSNYKGQWKDNKDNLWCTYCNKPRHTKDKRWKLNGKPPSKEWGYRGGH
ncbi:hypothetical protein CR513_47469, partial [Mucuna pruriens]